MMNIFFNVNNAYADKLLVTMISILENNKDMDIDFYVLSSDFSGENKSIINKTLNIYNKFKVNYIEINRDVFAKANLKNNAKYISLEGYYRYIIADVAPNINKALYLDADLIVNGSLNKLYSTDIEKYYCAGVKDKFIEEINYKRKIGLSPNDIYINSGVMLLNLNKLRRDKIGEKLLNNTIELADIIEYQDQDIINITFKGKIKELDSKYNFASSNVLREKNKIKEAIIIHYTGPIKPWDNNCKHRLRMLWKQYYSKMLILQGRKKETVIYKIMKYLDLAK